EIVEQLQERLQKTYAYFGQEARKAVQDQNLSKAMPLTDLHEFYIALYGWISEPLLLTAGIDLKRIRKDLMSDRLATCRLPDPLECSSDLWKSLLMPQAEASIPLSSNPDVISPYSFLNLKKTLPNPLSMSPQQMRNGYGDSRVKFQKHGHDSHGQEISNCLVQQSKPGPE